MERTADLPVKQDVPYRFADLVVEAKREIADVADTGIGVEDLVERLCLLAEKCRFPEDFPEDFPWRGL